MQGLGFFNPKSCLLMIVIPPNPSKWQTLERHPSVTCHVAPLHPTTPPPPPPPPSSHPRAPAALFHRSSRWEGKVGAIDYIYE